MFRLFPDHWLEHLKPGEFKVGDVPHNEILLRWTAAIKAKWEKLKVYHTKNIVAASDAYVIAVNGCQLGAFPLNEGVSRYPYAVEAVYPLGPGALTIDKHGKIGNPFVTTRLAIQTAKGAPVPTSLFLDKRCESWAAPWIVRKSPTFLLLSCIITLPVFPREFLAATLRNGFPFRMVQMQ
jgi:type I restriction enzyme S subunit